MRTIDINLIGELGKAARANKIELQKETVDAKTKIIVLILLFAVLVIFTVSFGTWLFAKNAASKTEGELNLLKVEHNKLKLKKDELSAYKKELEQELKIAKLKSLAKNQIDNLYIPWSRVLKDLTFKIPKDIVVFNLEKTTGKGSNSAKMQITGTIPSNKDGILSRQRMKPLTAISFFILNINEDKESLLTNAKISSIRFDSETGLYEFKIEADIRKEVELNKIIEEREKAESQTNNPKFI